MANTRARAKQVTYKSDATGGAVRNLHDKLSETVSVKDFGAIGDGVTDDTAAIQACFDYAATNGLRIVDHSGNTYRYTTDITVSGNLEIDGNVTFNGVGAYISVTGSLTEVGYVSAAVTKGDATLTFSSVAGLAENDLIIIHDTLDNSYSSHRPAYQKGEFARVRSVSGSNVTLDITTKFAYTGTTTDKVFKVNPCRVSIRGCVFNTDDEYALRATYCVNSDFTDCVFTNTGVTATTYGALSINKSYGVSVIGGKFFKAYSAASGLDYGIVVSGSENVNIYSAEIFGGRHAVSTGGDGTNGSVVCKNIIIRDCILTNDPASLVYCADFHGDTMNSKYVDCVIYGRIGLAGEDNGAVRCEIHTHETGVYTPIQHHEVVGGDIYFNDCHIHIGSSATPTSIVATASSSFSPNIDNPYNIIVRNITVNSVASLIMITNAYEASGQANTWVVDGFNVIGNTSSFDRVIGFTLAGAGVDASYIEVSNPMYAISNTIIPVTKSGTTLPNVTYRLYESNGSNSNGEWTKLADGTMICRHTLTATEPLSTGFIGGFRGSANTWTFPVAFTDEPEVSATAANSSAFGCSISGTKSTTSVGFFFLAITSQTSAAREASLIAVGKWV